MRSTTDRRALGTTHGVADDWCTTLMTFVQISARPQTPARRWQSKHLHAASIPLLATVASRMVHSSLLCALPAMLTRDSVLRRHSHHTQSTPSAAMPDPVACMPQEVCKSSAAQHPAPAV